MFALLWGSLITLFVKSNVVVVLFCEGTLV